MTQQRRIDVDDWQRQKETTQYAPNARAQKVKNGLEARLPAGVGGWIAGRPFGVTRWVFVHWIAWIPDGGLASFAYSFLYLAVCFIPVWILYRKKIFLKV